jgi:hypothetical protein
VHKAALIAQYAVRESRFNSVGPDTTGTFMRDAKLKIVWRGWSRNEKMEILNGEQAK